MATAAIYGPRRHRNSVVERPSVRAAGLTLIFGILGVINLAHGSFYMIGAYLAYWLSEKTGSLALAIALALPASLLLGWLVERLAIAFLYQRDHLYRCC